MRLIENINNLVLKEMFTGDSTSNTVYQPVTTQIIAIAKCGKFMKIVRNINDLAPGCVFIDLKTNCIHFTESDAVKVDEYVEIFDSLDADSEIKVKILVENKINIEEN